MTVAQMDAQILLLLGQGSTTGDTNFDTATRLAAINAANFTMCVVKELGTVEQRVAIVSGQWEYDFPTPSSSLTIAAPLQAVTSSTGFLSVRSMLNRQSAIVGQPVELEKWTYEEITVRHFRIPLPTYPYNFLAWANRKPRRGFVLFPRPSITYAAADSPIYVTFVAQPKVLTGTDDESTILLPTQYHMALCYRAASILLLSIEADMSAKYEQISDAMLTELVGHDNANLNKLAIHRHSPEVWRYNGRN